MISAASIKAIHAAATSAALPDSQYRAILLDVAGVSTCKLLTPQQVGRVIDAIGQTREKASGLKPAQVDRIRRYQLIAGLSDTDLRLILHEVSGQMHEESPKLTNYHFDRLMIRLEMRVADAVARGDAEWPRGYDPHYWRRRNTAGHMTTRQDREIERLWAQLKPHLEPEHQTRDYLLGVAGHGCGRVVRSLDDLSAWQAKNVIDALKDRIHYATRETVANDRPAPF